jgi:eukaryotic-like serine/threonine-protein kinase
MAITPETEPESASAEPRTGREAAVETAQAKASDADLALRPRVRTGVTKTGVTGTSTPVGPTPPPLPMGLHAPAPTPGPVTQHFVTLGRYQLLSRLAVGGMAEVYLARQGEIAGFKTLVVVKKVLPHLAVNPDFIAMFLDEARIASMLDHPNVVRINEVGRADSEYFLAMELVQGKPLATILRQSERAKTPLPHGLGALIVSNAAAGLHHAHQLTDAAGNLLGLVHRDVSPQNIMVSFEGSVKVIDFGIARALGRLGDTSSGALKGKLGYMAPEQARGETVDARADIFSLGVVLWECVACRRLFLRENELATLRAVVYEPIPKVSKYAKVDPTLEVIIEHMLSRDLEERFQTAEEVRVALERWVFAAGGQSTRDLSVLMKSWFPSDYAQWQRAARLALDMQESDPPIEMAFPDLASGKSGGSKTGTSRPESTGSGRNARFDSSHKGITSQVIPIPSMPAPELQLKPRSHAAAWLVVILAILAGGVAVYAFLWNKAPPVPITDSQTTPPLRPKVEILPSAEPSGAAPARGGGTSQSAEQDQGASGEGNAASKKKNRATSEEKSVILEQDGSGSRKHTRPSENRSGGKKKSTFRPNPF